MRRREVTVALQTDKALKEYGPLAVAIEDYGFDGVTVYNDLLYQPAWLPLLEIAHATSRVRIGPAAVNPFTCHPINMAGHIALIDEASQGRAYLGVARGGWLDFLGLRPQGAIAAIRECLECVRHLLRQSTEPYEGVHFSLAGGDSLRWTIGRSEIPFLLGTWGPRTLRACAGSIDEIKVGGTANPDVMPVVAGWLSGASPGGGEIGVVVGAVTVVDEDPAAARKLARREVALYLPVVAELDPTVEIEPERLARIRSAADRYDFEAAGALISDDLLERFAFAGTPEEVASQAIRLYEAGASRVEFGTPHGLSPQSGLRLLGEQVLPRLSAALERE